MCLITDGDLSVAKKNIKCYVVRIVRESGEICSPVIQSFKWKLGETYANVGETPSVGMSSGKYIYSHGYFHSFRYKKDANSLAKLLVRMYYKTSTYTYSTTIPKVYKAIIPKGSRYVDGLTHNLVRGLDNLKCYASTQLKMEET